MFGSMVLMAVLLTGGVALPASIDQNRPSVAGFTLESSTPAAPTPPTPTVTPISVASEMLSTNPDLAPLLQRLAATPILFNMDTPTLDTIFQHGQELGSRADVFTKVGDSNTVSGDFLLPIGLEGNYCELGDYQYLQETIDFFSVSPREGSPNSFNSSSKAVERGLSSSAALDPFWASSPCEANESPVTCEYRLVRPSVAIINLGLMDVRYATEDSFRANMEQIVQLSIEQGVIPVLNTIVVLPDQETLSFEASISINADIVDIAETYEIPLINLWAAVQSLPNFGIGPDRTHFKHVVGEFCDFDGAEREIGGTLRNLLTLQALDELRRNVLTQ
jgi:hypothetical protein